MSGAGLFFVGLLVGTFLGILATLLLTNERGDTA
jgi:hypothetical protein